MSIQIPIIVTADILLYGSEIYLWIINKKNRFSNSSKELSNLFNIYRLHQIFPITQFLWPKDEK